MGDCSTRHKDIEQGKIKVADGKTTYYDGRHIPREPKNKTQAIKVDEYWAKRNYNGDRQYTFTEQYANMLEEDYYDLTYDPREDELRTLRAENNALSAQLTQQESNLDEPNELEVLKAERRALELGVARMQKQQKSSFSNQASAESKAPVILSKTEVLLAQTAEGLARLTQLVQTNLETNKKVQFVVTRGGAGDPGDEEEGF